MTDEQTAFPGDIPADLVFDDDPIEDILYGSAPTTPSEASIFGPARRLLEEISSADPPGSDLLTRCERFVEEQPITSELVARLWEMLAPLTESEDGAGTPEMQAQIGRLRDALRRRAASHRLRE
jgi:hypothetical protein